MMAPHTRHMLIVGNQFISSASVLVRGRPLVHSAYPLPSFVNTPCSQTFFPLSGVPKSTAVHINHACTRMLLAVLQRIHK